MNNHFDLEQRMQQIQRDIENKNRDAWMLDRIKENGWLYRLFHRIPGGTNSEKKKCNANSRKDGGPLDAEQSGGNY
jgi:hypothetical protein